MSEILKSVLTANEQFSSGFDGQDLASAPRRGFAILTCMDARIDPAKFAGLAPGDAHVIRNAGGRASDDAIRSLVFSYKLLGTREWFVVHHTRCGLQSITDQEMGELLASSLEVASHDGTEWKDPGGKDGSLAGSNMKWLTFKNTTESVCTDVRRLREHPLVPGRIPIYGFVYDCATGRLNEVPDAMKIGRAV